MPRHRQRIVFCDCLDCTDRSNEQLPSGDQLAACEAAARQEPPPKCLVILASGFVQPSAPPTAGGEPASNTLDDDTYPHLDGLVRDGHVGFLASRTAEAQRPGAPGEGRGRGGAATS